MFDKIILKQIRNNNLTKLSDTELQHTFHSCNRRKTSGSTLAYRTAICVEVIKRTTGLELFDVQIIGALKLLKGNIVEMKTGEGKTIVAVLTALLRYLEGGKTHVVTVNDYLVERDGKAAQQTFGFLNLRAEYIISSDKENRKDKYDNADVLYITNSELGFDYLRSNGAYQEEDIVFNTDNALVIVDEADSVLIDEARIPLILSAVKQLSMTDYKRANAFVKTIKNDKSLYEVDLKDRQCFLTAEGCQRADKYFNLKNSYSSAENVELRHLVEQALSAHTLMQRDKEYIVYNGEVKLIDQSTGRIAEGRRFTRGLHQAIEAKENVEIHPENAIIATITYQNLFKLYKTLSGMTGTAYTERKEFKEIYNVKVVRIDTNKPVIRKDQKDLIFANNINRNRYFIDYIKEQHKTGRPILIGTSSIEQSEEVAALLRKNGMIPQVLNAKNNELEAEIVARAGQKDALTVATNMAGRGTDIKLGEGVVDLGGLLIVGMGHYNNIRIDNQLRGRAGRQGDPGESIFFVSLEDELVQIFAGETLKKLITSLNNDNDSLPITNVGFSKAVKNAQYQIQVKSFNQRKSTIEYDEILGKYRDLYYAERMNILKTDKLTEIIQKILKLDFEIDIDEASSLAIRQQMLLTMDSCWINFLALNEDLRYESSYEAYAGTKPIVIYEEKLAEYYSELLQEIRQKIENLFQIKR